MKITIREISHTLVQLARQYNHHNPYILSLAVHHRDPYLIIQYTDESYR